MTLPHQSFGYPNDTTTSFLKDHSSSYCNITQPFLSLRDELPYHCNMDLLPLELSQIVVDTLAHDLEFGLYEFLMLRCVNSRSALPCHPYGYKTKTNSNRTIRSHNCRYHLAPRAPRFRESMEGGGPHFSDFSYEDLENKNRNGS